MIKRMAWTAALALLAIPTLAQAGVSSSEWREIETRYKKLLKEGRKIEAIEELGKADDVRAVEVMVHMLMFSFEKRDVRDELTERIGATKDEKAVAFLAKQLSNRKIRPNRLPMLCTAVARIDNGEIRGALRKLLSNRDPQVKSSAIDALGELKDRESLDGILEALNDKVWQVRFSAVYALVKLGDKKAIEPLIARLEKEEGEGRIEGDIQKALRALTGADQDSAPGWRSWWKLNEDKGLTGGGAEAWKNDSKESEGLTGKNSGGGSVATYYGIKIYSKRIVFVLDRSGSMNDKFKGAKPKKAQVVEISGMSRGGKKRGRTRKAILPWGKIRTKWDLAREQLIFTLRQLDDKTQFNIVLYSTDVKPWKPRGLVAATKGNISAAIAMLKSTKPDGSTNIYGALKKSFTLTGGQQPVEISNYKSGADTIFFLTDGWAYGAGKIVWKKHGKKAEVNPDWPEAMIDAVREWNMTRKVKINTVGIGEDGEFDEALLSALAEEFGGVMVVPGRNRPKDD